jgi:branched-subunit amino acid transport protein AzlD
MYYLEIKRIRIRTVVSCLQINTIQSEGASLPALASVRYGTALRINNKRVKLSVVVLSVVVLSVVVLSVVVTRGGAMTLTEPKKMHIEFY